MGWRYAIAFGGALVAALGPGTASAQHGFYVSGHGGFLFLPKLEGTTGNTLFVNDFTTKIDSGYVFGGTLGYRFSWGGRIEGEVSYGRNGISDFRLLPSEVPPLTSTIDGHFTALTIMGNALYQFELFPRFRPYLGAGAGAAQTRMLVNLSLPPNLAAIAGVSTLRYVDDRQWVFAWQGIAGAEYSITERLALGLRYRLLGLPSIRFRAHEEVFQPQFDPFVKTKATLTHSVMGTLVLYFWP
jgi:opacity protein-like surface antigen